MTGTSIVQIGLSTNHGIESLHPPILSAHYRSVDSQRGTCLPCCERRSFGTCHREPVGRCDRLLFMHSPRGLRYGPRNTKLHGSKGLVMAVFLGIEISGPDFFGTARVFSGARDTTKSMEFKSFRVSAVLGVVYFRSRAWTAFSHRRLTRVILVHARERNPC